MNALGGGLLEDYKGERGYDCFIEPQYFLSPDKLKSRALPFKAVVGTQYYPDKYTYRYMSGGPLNQNPVGMCWMTATLNLTKFFVWLHTGKKLNYTHNEALDFAADAHKLTGKNRVEDKIKGGFLDDGINGLYRYNTDEWQAEHKWSSGKSECLTEFFKICEKLGITSDNIQGPNMRATKEAVMNTLSKYGLFVWMHDAHYYGHPSEEAYHAIAGIGYDNDYFYFKNSWSSNDDDTSMSHYGKVDWDNFDKASEYYNSYNISIQTLNPLLWTSR